jgi:hypothetical protein
LNAAWLREGHRITQWLAVAGGRLLVAGPVRSIATHQPPATSG